LISEIALKDIIKTYSNKEIGEILHIINNNVLFSYLNAISIYFDILKAVLKFREEELNINNDFILPENILKLDLSIYLEM
jgi:hypothetical protein